MKTLKKRSLTDSWSGSRMRILTARVLTAVLTVSLLMGVSACSSEDGDDLLQRSEADSETVSTALTLEQALERAIPDLNMLDPETRSNGRVVESSKTIHLKGVSNTRSGEKEDLDVYVVNFADNGGYAILGSDTRMSAVYGMSPEGSLDLEASEGSPIDFYLSDILPKIVDYELSTTDGISLPGGSGGPIIGVDTILPNPLPDNPAIPLIKKYPAENWIPGKSIQGLRLDNLGVVTAQISSYYKFPYSYNGRNLNWDLAISGNEDEENNLFYVIQEDAFYSDASTSEYPHHWLVENDYKSLKGTFNNLGYNISYKPFTRNAVISQIDAKHPVIVMGYSEEGTGVKNLSTNGYIPNNHRKGYRYSWIIDAYGYTGNPLFVGSKLYFHCVWGHAVDYNKYVHTNGFFYFLLNQRGDIDRNSPDVNDADLDEGASWGDYYNGLADPYGMLFTDLFVVTVQDPHKNK